MGRCSHPDPATVTDLWCRQCKTFVEGGVLQPWTNDGLRQMFARIKKGRPGKPVKLAPIKREPAP